MVNVASEVQILILTHTVFRSHHRPPVLFAHRRQSHQLHQQCSNIYRSCSAACASFSTELNYLNTEQLEAGAICLVRENVWLLEERKLNFSSAKEREFFINNFSAFSINDTRFSFIVPAELNFVFTLSYLFPRLWLTDSTLRVSNFSKTPIIRRGRSTAEFAACSHQ